MNKIVNVTLFVLMLLTACGDKNEPDAVMPIRFDKNDYSIKFGVSSSIPFTDGGGVYELKAGDPNVLGEVSIDNDTHQLVIRPIKAGESTLTVTDLEAGSSVTLNITVEDFYISFIIVDIEGTNTNKYFQLNCELRFIRDEDNTKPIKVVWHNPMSFREYTVEGHFNIDHSEATIFTMEISLQAPKEEDVEQFEYTMGGDGEYMRLFDRIFGFNWDKEAYSSRSTQPKDIKMILTDKSNDCKITCQLEPTNN